MSIKQSTGVAVSPTEAASGLLKQDLMKNLGSLGLTALGVGAGARGIMGLYNLMRRRSVGSNMRQVKPVPVDVPYPVKQKQASFEAVKKFFGGDYAQTMGQIPWAMPAAAAVGLGGVGLGWTALDGVLDKRRKAQVEDEVATARQEFDQALMSQFDKPKTAAEELSVELDKMFDAAQQTTPEKRAFLEEAAGPLGSIAGAGMTVAGLGSLAAAMAVYNAVKKRNNDSILESAQKRRQRRNYTLNPTPLWARPVPAAPEAPAIEGS